MDIKEKEAVELLQKEEVEVTGDIYQLLSSYQDPGGLACGLIVMHR
ncbi:hypothetical protein [Facilibium subflavum]|nr:hypothetical protein [Facilibium subflavum]